MKLVLTNVGHRRALFLRGEGAPADRPDPPLLRILESPRRWLPSTGDAVERDLVRRGLAETVPDAVPDREIRLRLRRNPIENVTKLAIEFTTRCNFRCRHCFNAYVPRVTETRLEGLARATDLFGWMGVRDFVFVGGEVTKFGDGWLDLAARLRSRGARAVGVIPNGWWLGGSGFEAAGRRYAAPGEYFDALRAHGVTHVVFSIDGRAADHDRCRDAPGLYARILAGIDATREAGLSPRVSLVLRGRDDERAHLEELARRLYPEAGGDALRHLEEDWTNIRNNFISFGRAAARAAGGGCGLREAGDRALRCAHFYRPAPHLTLKASGEIATCRLATAGEGYGNIHEGDLAGTLNRLQERFVGRLHSGGGIAGYRDCVDPRIFGDRFDDLCTLRAVLTMIARRMHERGIGAGDRAEVARINREVALVTGHLRGPEPPS